MLGSVALVVIVPGKDVAFAIMTNAEETSALAAIQYRLLDHYLGVSSPDWIGALHELRKASDRERSGGTCAPRRPRRRRRAARARRCPSRNMRAATAMTGTAHLHRERRRRADRSASSTRRRSPASSSTCSYDTFRTHWTDRSYEDAYVTFALKPDGSIDRVTMKAISPLADFSFDFHDLALKPAH